MQAHILTCTHANLGVSCIAIQLKFAIQASLVTLGEMETILAIYTL